MPWTPTPGGVEDEQRYTPSNGVAYGLMRAIGRVQLRDVRRTAGNIASDEIRVLKVRREHGVTLVDAVAKPRSESLDLSLDTVSHVNDRSIRHMTVCPQRMSSCGRARRIEPAGLNREHSAISAIVPPRSRAGDGR